MTAKWLVAPALAFVGALSSSSGATQEPERPNILFIFTDDHAPHAIERYGGSKINPTPTIDRLAEQGMLFDQSFCTNSICGPSRAVILTGKHSHVNGFMDNGNRSTADQQTFPKLLRGAGYQTALVGKWHLKSDPRLRPLGGAARAGRLLQPRLPDAGGRGPARGLLHRHRHRASPSSGSRAARTTRHKPFLLMCQHKAPHRNWHAGAQVISTCTTTSSIPEPDDALRRHEGDASPARHATTCRSTRT